MKAYTDIEQSKKLAEILPLKSADMDYIPVVNIDGEYSISVNEWDNDHIIDEGWVPCWSLTALLGILPFHLIVNNQRYLFNMVKGLNKNGETYAIKYAIYNTTFYFHLTDFYNNPIDACYEMIFKLHKQNLL